MTTPLDPLFVQAVESAKAEVECRRLEKQLIDIYSRDILAAMAAKAEGLEQSRAATVKARRASIRLVHSQD